MTPLRDRRRFTSRILTALAAAVLAVTVSCGGKSASEHRVVEIVVPPGTQDRLDRGELVNVMPAKLEFRVGDTIRVRNDDDAVQYAGPYRIEAGQQFELTYGAAGRYGGYCNLSGGDAYEIVIKE